MILIAVAGLLPGQLAEPVAGWTRDASGNLRPLLGAPGGFLLGEPFAGAAEHFAVSSYLALWKAGNKLTAVCRTSGVSASLEVPGLLFFAPPGKEALVFAAAAGFEAEADGGRPHSGRLLVFRRGQFEYGGEVNLPGAVAAVGGTPEQPQWLVKEGGSLVWLERDGDHWRTRRRLENAQAPAFLSTEAIAYRRGTELIAERGEGLSRVEHRLAVDPEELAPMEDGWIWIRSGRRFFALRLRDFELFELPREEGRW
jgi:hypothetical protein